MLLTGVLLFALLPPSLANGLKTLQPTFKHNARQTESALIRDLLDPRQAFCNPGFFSCSARGCCPTGYSCCTDGNCCQPFTTCFLASNNIIGCCPNGNFCTGPVGAPTGTTPPTPTVTTLLGAPTQSFGSQLLQVSVLDIAITWSKDWLLDGESSCDSSILSMFTSIEGSSFTYIHSYAEVSTYGYYLNTASSNAKWQVFIDGEPHGPGDATFFIDAPGCTYLQPGIPSGRLALGPQNLTLVVNRASLDQPLLFEFNMMLHSITPSSNANTNAAGRPLLVFTSGILLAVLYYA